MPKIKTADGVSLYYEEAGAGTPVIFVHEFAGDYRTWEPQMRRFARSHRCVTYSQRGYPPSDIPNDPARYGQDIARGDVIAVMDALGIDKAHVVGHSMGAYTALHVGMRHPRALHLGDGGRLRLGFAARSRGARGDARASRRDRQDVHRERHGRGRGDLCRCARRGRRRNTRTRAAMREFARMLAEHSAQGHALTMAMLQSKRPTLWDMEADLKKFSVPLLVICGDEDETCLDGSVFLKRTAPTAALLVIPRSGHTITSEEPAAVNAALAELFAAAEAGRWLAHKPPA